MSEDRTLDIDVRSLTPESYRVIDAAMDRDGVYAKPYTQRVDGKLTTVGLRIGEKPGSPNWNS